MFKKLLSSLAIVVATATAGHAATLYSATIIPASNWEARCNALNVGTKDLAVTVNLYQMTSASPALVRTFTQTLLPLRSIGISDRYDGGINGYFCEFVVKGPKSKVRATACAASSLGAPGLVGCISSVEVR